jgi:plastocyanin
MKRNSALLIIAGLAATLQIASAGDITGTVSIKGTPPKEKDITPLKDDANCGKFHAEMPTTHFYVVGANNELADVIVSVQGISGKSTGASAPPVVLNQQGCTYSPAIFAVQTGQKIVIKNSDPTPHNVHSRPQVDGNKEENVLQMPGSADLTFSFAKPEPFLKFECNVHPWMFSWACVFDHPYFAVTGKDGTFKIANVPAGKYTLQAAHRKLSAVTKEVEVTEGAPTKVDFTLEVK